MNFGRFRGPNGPAGGGSATSGERDRGGDGGGGRDADPAVDWRLWRRPHWTPPAVSAASSRGESASSGPGQGGKVPVPDPARGGKCQFRNWRRSGGAARFEAARSGVSARSRSWTRSRRRRWNPRSRIAARAACSERPMGYGNVLYRPLTPFSGFSTGALPASGPCGNASL